MADLSTLLARLQYGASINKNPRNRCGTGIYVVARDGTEPPTRGFSVVCRPLYSKG